MNMLISSTLVILSTVLYGTVNWARYLYTSNSLNMDTPTEQMQQTSKVFPHYLCSTNRNIDLLDGQKSEWPLFSAKINDAQFVFIVNSKYVNHFFDNKDINLMKNPCRIFTNNQFIYRCCAYSQQSQNHGELTDIWGFDYRIDLSHNAFQFADIMKLMEMTSTQYVQFKYTNSGVGYVIKARHKCRYGIELDKYPEIQIHVIVQNLHSNQTFDYKYQWFTG